MISLNERHITENKRFWKTVKPLLLNKVQSSEKVKLAGEDDTLITNEGEVAMAENIDHPLKGIVRYRKHPNIVALVSEFTKECLGMLFF